MDVDREQQHLPFISGGLHSLVLSGVKVPTLQESIIALLDVYFCDKEIKNILKLAASAYPNCGYQRGFVPAALLASFKAAKELRATPQVFLITARTLIPGAFEVSADGSCMRRMVSFNQRNAAEVVKKSSIITKSCCLFKGIPKDTPENDFISFITSKFGEVEKYQFSARSLVQEFIMCHVNFTDPQIMINLLASSKSLEYDDNSISISLGQFPETQPSPKKSTTPSFDFNHPSLTSCDPRSLPIKQKGQPSVQASAVLGFPLNRVIKFTLKQDPETLGSTSSSIQATARSEFQKLAPVSECIFTEGDLCGYVRFKRSVAKEVAEMTMRHGGIDLGFLGHKIPVVGLQGEEERMFHEVAKEKGNLSKNSLANMNVKAMSTVKSRRIKEQQQKKKPKRKGISLNHASLVTTAVHEGGRKGKKRLADDDDAPMDAALDNSRTKKVKVDDLADLVKALRGFDLKHGRIEEAWDRVAGNVNLMCEFAVSELKATGKNCAHRFKELMKKLKADEMESLRASGMRKKYLFIFGDSEHKNATKFVAIDISHKKTGAEESESTIG
ncbi:hypothetical protein BDR26DRAFT_1008173 [Obelidium mucronatum]|nr:hypothetical protein BDR26DRAFT_1008173 [Obelidium mucronatum]